MSTIDTKIEGWTWLANAKKWHYFKGGRSLCQGYLLFRHPGEGYQAGNDASPDNCKACQRELQKAKEAPGK